MPNKCPTHVPQRVKEPEYRPNAHARGYGQQHRRWRTMILARDPICVKCERAPATNADHVIPLSRGGTWELSNGQGLCTSCHSRKTALEDGGFGNG